MKPVRARWEVLDSPDPAEVGKLANALSIPETLAAILINRDYRSEEAARTFLRPSLDNLHDPFLMLGMEKAVEVVLDVARRGKRILVHGDYDVDGQCAATLLTRTLRAGGADVVPFVPHRIRDGYDFGPAGIEAASREGAELIITCDCGITAREAVRDARAAGLSVIVTDHHIVGELPEANSVLNPKRPGCKYPFKELCGTGVAFKLAQALIGGLGIPVNFQFHLLDLVALATVADIVPLVGENRTLVRHGLKLLADSNWVGVRALVKSAGIDGPVTAGQVGFRIGPRLNAAGRVSDAMDGVKLLLCDDPAEAASRARQLDALNSDRQELDQRALTEAIELVETEFDLDTEYGLVLAAEGWHAGVIGIVASRIVERYHRPALLISIEGETGKGSGRSIPGFDLHAALSECSSLLDRFGGHQMAAGLTIQRRRIEELRDAFNSVVRQRLQADDLIPMRRVDLMVSLDQIDDRLEGLFAHLEPCGIGNPRPVLGVRSASATAVREIKGKHLKLVVDDGAGRLDAIGFNWVDRVAQEALDGSVRVAFHLTRNEFRGQSTLQARVVDIGAE